MSLSTCHLGLIRQAQRGFATDFEVNLAFDNISGGQAQVGEPAMGYSASAEEVEDPADTNGVCFCEEVGKGIKIQVPFIEFV